VYQCTSVSVYQLLNHEIFLKQDCPTRALKLSLALGYFLK
jgi:hypothetical protein